jgi:hypothetical protein
VGALFRVRDVSTAITYVFTYPVPSSLRGREDLRWWWDLACLANVGLRRRTKHKIFGKGTGASYIMVLRISCLNVWIRSISLWKRSSSKQIVSLAAVAGWFDLFVLGTARVCSTSTLRGSWCPAYSVLFCSVLYLLVRRLQQKIHKSPAHPFEVIFLNSPRSNIISYSAVYIHGISWSYVFAYITATTVQSDSNKRMYRQACKLSIEWNVALSGRWHSSTQAY